QAFFYGLAFSAPDPDHLRRYTTWPVLGSAAIPGPWILFSLTYSRGNWRAFVQRWRVLLIAAFIVPAGIVLLFRERCVLGLRDGSQPQSWFVALGWPGSVLVLATLLGSIFVLMNVERTFRASVGTMRWRIKYMVLGLAV